MAHFIDLPFEIHKRILSYLPSNRDVAALSIQCRFLHGVCDMETRRKYRRLRITPDRKSLNHAFDMLFEILSRPSLGRYVRRIEYINCPSYRIEEKHPAGYERDPSPAEIQLLRTTFHAAGFTDSDVDGLMVMLFPSPVEETDWHRRLNEHRSQAVNIAQVLTLLHISVSPDVEYIAIPPPFDPLSHSWGAPRIVDCPIERLIDHVNANPKERPFLQNLRTLHILNEQEGPRIDTEYYCELDFARCIALFQNLPAIESIRTEVIQEQEEEPFPPCLVPATSNLSRISIQHSRVDSTYLATIASSCKTLRSFECSLGGRAEMTGSYPMFNPKTFIQAMLLHRTSVEELDLDIEAGWPFDIEKVDEEFEEEMERNFDVEGGREEGNHTTAGILPDELWEQTGSLKDLASLKRLKLGIMFLIYFAKGVNVGKSKDFNLADNLPPNLEELVIRGYERGANEDHDAQINALIAFKESGSSKISDIRGIEDMIPNAEDFDTNGDEDNLWQREDEQWSDVE